MKATTNKVERYKLMNNYFGSKIAIYFSFLHFYTYFLISPAIIGAFFYARYFFRFTSDYTNDPMISMFTIGIIIWCASFLALWKRKAADTSYQWGVFGVEQKQLVRSMATTKVVAGEKLYKFAVTVPVILVYLLVLIRVMIAFQHLMNSAEKTYGVDSYWKYWPALVYSLVPSVAGMVYEYLVVILNDFEEHESEDIAEYYLVVKQFVFHFVNRYCALFYILFWLQDMERLRALLISLLVTYAVS